MADLKAQFETAVAESKQLPEKPDNMTLLKIYALYKQATAGDVEGKRPGFTDMVGRAKWDAWNELKAKLGFLLGAFSKTIEAEIEKNLDALLAKGAKVVAKKVPKKK